MTTTSDHNWTDTGFRPVSDFDGYVVNAAACVWSVGRTVSTKGGATRVTKAKELKPDDKNRVALRREGKTIKVRVDQLVLQAFPPKHHLRLERLVVLHCRWCGRSFSDFLASYCSKDDRGMWPDLFRCPHCTTGVTSLPDQFPTPPISRRAKNYI